MAWKYVSNKPWEAGGYAGFTMAKGSRLAQRVPELLFLITHLECYFCYPDEF